MDDELVVENEAVSIAPTFDDDYDFHDCEDEADDDGVCLVCGNLVIGSRAFCDYLRDHRDDFF